MTTPGVLGELLLIGVASRGSTIEPGAAEDTVTTPPGVAEINEGWEMEGLLDRRGLLGAC